MNKYTENNCLFIENDYICNRKRKNNGYKRT